MTSEFMKNRLVALTQKSKNKKLFCAFLTLGFPSIQATEKLILEFEKAGVDILELGFPFSDPMADGPTIQYSSEEALKKGVGMEDAFQLVARLRRKGCQIPMVLFTYLNPVYHFGIKEIVKRAKQSGMDGFIIPDAPPEEELEFSKACHKAGLSRVFLVAPTTEPKRAKKIVHQTEGFLYYVSLRGVTGARKALPSDIEKNLKMLRKTSKKPVLIGFGISSPEQSRKMGAISSGVIVGSAIVDHLRKAGGNLKPTVNFVSRMVQALKSEP